MFREDTNHGGEMYNVEFVKKNHNFFANRVLVHNKHVLNFEDIEFDH